MPRSSETATGKIWKVETGPNLPSSASTLLRNASLILPVSQSGSETLEYAAERSPTAKSLILCLANAYTIIKNRTERITTPIVLYLKCMAFLGRHRRRRCQYREGNTEMPVHSFGLRIAHAARAAKHGNRNKVYSWRYPSTPKVSSCRSGCSLCRHIRSRHMCNPLRQGHRHIIRG